jgi:adenylylsulfate kinase
MKKILIMGLPGAGKTTLASALDKLLTVFNKKTIWLNADKVREEFNDWDFSLAGRIRQSTRMRELAEKIECDYVIADFVAPLIQMRSNFNADYTIWVDTIAEGRYTDTNKIFVPPGIYDFRVTEQDAEKWAKIICEQILENNIMARTALEPSS